VAVGDEDQFKLIVDRSLETAAVAEAGAIGAVGGGETAIVATPLKRPHPPALQAWT
jgi:hypothetical protein